eukprot:scaffold105790_cov21-Tisochrysis_lutea.AAC.4
MNAPRSLPALKDLCVQVVALNFEENPTFGPLPEKYIRKITNILALDLPLELVGSVSLSPVRVSACLEKTRSMCECQQSSADCLWHVRDSNRQTKQITLPMRS